MVPKIVTGRCFTSVHDAKVFITHPPEISHSAARSIVERVWKGELEFPHGCKGKATFSVPDGRGTNIMVSVEQGCVHANDTLSGDAMKKAMTALKKGACGTCALHYIIEVLNKD